MNIAERVDVLQKQRQQVLIRLSTLAPEVEKLKADLQKLEGAIEALLSLKKQLETDDEANKQKNP